MYPTFIEVENLFIPGKNEQGEPSESTSVNPNFFNVKHKQISDVFLN